MTGTSQIRINKKHDASQLLTSLKINIELLRRAPSFQTPEVEKILTDCIPIAEEILTWAPQYDFQSETETYTSNGYWSIIIVANKLAEYVMQHPDLAVYVQDVLYLLTSGFPLLKATHEYSLNGPKGRVLHSESTPVLIDLMHLYLNSPKIIEALCGPACGPHLCASERLTRDAYQTVVSMYSSSNWVEAFKCLTSRKFRGKRMAIFAKKFDVQFTQKVLSISDYEPVRTWLPIFSTFFRKLEAKNIFIEKSYKYQIVFTAEGQPELKVAEAIKERPSIRCKYLCYGKSGGENNNSNALLFALHGGGFAAQSPETHEFYTRHWAPKMPGVPILSVDYSHAPKYKFPYALQEILDVYMWLTNVENSKEVIQEIGFFPERVVLFGDSAGGNQAMSLLLVLNDIRRLAAENPAYDKFLMPAGIVTCYAAFNIIPKFAPSYFMTSIDPFLSPMVLFNLIDAYVPTQNMVCQDKLNEVYEWSSSGKPAPTTNWFSYAKDAIKWLYPFSTDTSLPDAWFACDKEELINRLSKFNNLFEHPYLSSIRYPHFESLKDIELYLITPYFDPLHDDSIEMAKAWKGPLTIYILDALSHGFLHFIQFSKEASEGCDLALTRVKKALRI